MEAIIAADGSIQAIEGIPDHVKAVFKTVSEVKLSAQLRMAKDRGAFVDQACSQNVYIPPRSRLGSKNEADVLVQWLFGAWDAGLKTGVYYTRTSPDAKTIQFTVAPRVESDAPPALIRARSTPPKEEEECEACAV
jgi:ribonucleotide reductase alpha subunit